MLETSVQGKPNDFAILGGHSIVSSNRYSRIIYAVRRDMKTVDHRGVAQL